tara:strand:+ start:1276 stop:1506 length:231 start_codon:yes stop_codon:yes gene_type:complete
MILIKYKNGVLTQHDNITDAMFECRNVCEVHQTTIDSIMGATENQISDLRTGVMLLNINKPTRINEPFQLSLNLEN